MKNADQANPKQLFRKCGGCFDGWDKIAGWILLLALVLGGTQVLPAQYSQDIRDATKQREKTGTAKQTEKTLPAADERQHWTAEPGCFGPENDVPDRTVSRSWTLMSPDGLYKAYAVNEAFVLQRDEGRISGCRSTTKLFVSGPGSTEEKVVLTIEPSEHIAGNSIELIDWSREGHRLVVMQGLWVWASDAGGIEARVYDADSGKVSDENLVYASFEKLMGKDCTGGFEPIGFSPDGKIVVKAYPNVDEEMIMDKDSCVKKMQIWSLDPVTAKLSRLRDNYQVRRYGKRAP
jgi:hypothetical protein